MPSSPTPRDLGTGVGLVLVATASVQVGAGLARSLFDALGPGGTVWLRLVAATIALGLAARPWRSSPQGAALRRWASDPRMRQVALFGAVLALMNTTFYLSIARIPLGLAVAVEFLGPLTLTLALSRRAADVGWALCAAAGLVALVAGPAIAEAMASRTAGGGDGGVPDLLGLALAAVAGGAWAAYIVCSQRVGALVPGARGLAAAMAVATALTLPLGVHALPRMDDPATVLAGLAVGLLSSAIPYGAELEALRRIPARVFGVLLALDPAAAALAGLAVLGERLHVGQWAGIALVCAAGAGATWSARSPARPANDTEPPGPAPA